MQRPRVNVISVDVCVCSYVW